MKRDKSKEKIVLCFLMMILILPLSSLIPSNLHVFALKPFLQQQQQVQQILPEQTANMEQPPMTEQQIQQQSQSLQMMPNAQSVQSTSPLQHSQVQQLPPEQLPMTEQQQQYLQNHLTLQQNQQQLKSPSSPQQSHQQLPPQLENELYVSSFQPVSPTPYTSGMDLRGQAISSIKNLSQNIPASYLPSISVSGNTVHIVWTTDDSTYRTKIMYTKSLNGGDLFEPVKTISNGGFRPTIAAEGNNIHVVYDTSHISTNAEIYYTKSTDGGATFSLPVNLSNTPDTSSRNPEIAKSGSTIHLVWDEHDLRSDSYAVLYKKSNNEGSYWSPSNIQLSQSGKNAYNPAIAVNSNNVHVVWSQSDSTSRPEIAYRNSKDGGIQFSLPRNLSNTQDDSYDPSIFASGNSIHVTWMEWFNVDETEIFYTRSLDNGVNFERYKNLSNNRFAESNSPSVSAIGNTVFVVWEVKTLGNFEIALAKSTNGGNSFATPVNLSNTPTSSRDPKVNSDVASGNLYYIWTEYGQTSDNQDIFFVYEKGVNLHINSITAKKPSHTFTISGILRETGTGTPLPNQQVAFTGTTGLTSIPYPVTTATDGTFRTSVTTISTEGSYRIKATYAGAQGYASVTTEKILNIDRTVPEIRLTSPANGAAFTAPASITVRADAQDKLFSTSTTFDGKIKNVEFLYKISTATDYTLIRSDTSSPYSGTIYNLPSGSYNIIARAYDEAGNRKTSSTVTVSVR